MHTDNMRQAFYEDELPELDIHLTLNFPYRTYSGCEDEVQVRPQHNRLVQGVLEEINRTPGRLISKDEVNEMLRLHEDAVQHSRENRTSEANRGLKQACPHTLTIKQVNTGTEKRYVPKLDRPIALVTNRITKGIYRRKEQPRKTILFPPGKPWWRWIIGR